MANSVEFLIRLQFICFLKVVYHILSKQFAFAIWVAVAIRQNEEGAYCEAMKGTILEENRFRLTKQIASILTSETE